MHAHFRISVTGLPLGLLSITLTTTYVDQFSFQFSIDCHMNNTTFNMFFITLSYFQTDDRQMNKFGIAIFLLLIWQHSRVTSIRK